MLCHTLILCAALALAIDANADEKRYAGRLFDGHVHYSHQVWEVYDTAAALKMLDDAEVRGALTSSTPHEGTQRLLDAKHPRVKIVPLFRPYTPKKGSTTWHKYPDRIASAKAAMETALHQGLGEVHIQLPVVLDSEPLQKLIRQVADKGMFIQPHSDYEVVERLFKIAPNSKIIWAHAGFADPPKVISWMMDRHENLWAELSYREDEINDVDGIDPQWKALFLRHPDRFMIGSDAWNVDRWYAFNSIIEENRLWLGHLPKDVADMIAHGNGEQLFGLR